MGKQADITLPATLAPGNYVLRFEIISLHFAATLGNAEFYPACTQLQIGGSQTGVPTADELVTFPGAYKDDDPGILGTSQFDPHAQYIFPGPPVAAFVKAAAKSSSGGLRGAENYGPTHFLSFLFLIITFNLL